jgi:alpha-tubulin suppressor-like RCC1 family protein
LKATTETSFKTLSKNSNLNAFKLKMNEFVFGFGNNMLGQLSISSEDELINIPRVVETLSNTIRTTRINCISGRTFAITSDGVVLSCGQNDNNELGRTGKRGVFSRIDSIEAFTLNEVALGSYIMTLK